MAVPGVGKFRYWFMLSLLAGSLLPALNSLAQGVGASPLEQLRQRLMSGPAITVLHLSNLHGSTRTLVRPVDNLVVDGVVRDRPMAGLLRGGDEIIPAGQLVRVTDVERAPGKKNDVLRVTVSTPGNAVALVAFVLPPQSLSSVTEAQMEALVFPALTPAAAHGASLPATGRVPVAEPSGPPSWTVRRTNIGTEALLRGTAEAGGHTSPALLVLSCPVTAVSPERPALSPLVELRLPKSSVAFDVAFVGDKDGDDNGYIHVQIGTSPEIHADLATWTVVPDTGNVAPLGLDLRAAELERLTQASASPLQIAVRPNEGPAKAVTARFTLPADPSPAQTAINACLQHESAAEAAVHASHSVECPQDANLSLISADVKRVGTGKSLPVDPDRDQGLGWTLPKATKAHPVPAKATLACSYGPLGQDVTTSRKATKTLTFPIPPGSDSCESWIETNESRSRAYCTKTAAH